MSMAVKRGCGARGIKAACPAVDQGRNPAGGWLPLSGETWPEARDPHRRGATVIISGRSLVQYVDFFSDSVSNVIINVLRERRRRE